MKYIFPILFLLLATQTLGHGEHQATDGVIFYVENESGNIVLDVTSLAKEVTSSTILPDSFST